LLKKLQDKDPFLDVAKAEDVRALGEMTFFVASRGTRTETQEITLDRLFAIEPKWRYVALEFIRTTIDPDPDSRPDSDVIIYHPFLFLGCQEVRQQFVSFLASHETKPVILDRIDVQMEYWLSKVPKNNHNYIENEYIGDLKDLINHICDTKLENYKELTLIVMSAYRTTPCLFSNFVWKLMVSLNSKVTYTKYFI
jgi:hypothetical protein